MQRIFVGDVQGCAAELSDLVERARRRFGAGYSLFCVGDLINRGPDSARALAIVREHVEAGRGEVVLGNHELHLLRVAFGLRAAREGDELSLLLARPDADEWIEWLRRRPVAVSGDVDGTPFVMVHAAVAPGWSLEDVMSRAAAIHAELSADDPGAARALLSADPATTPLLDDLLRMTSCRSVRARDPGSASQAWSSREPDDSGELQAWHRAWSAAAHPYGIVYGHWARQGLHVAPGLRGLDSGCVHHGRGRDGWLTGWLPDTHPHVSGEADGVAFGVPDDRFWKIPARRRYILD